jgi:hypothetical protein
LHYDIDQRLLFKIAIYYGIATTKKLLLFLQSLTM